MPLLKRSRQALNQRPDGLNYRFSKNAHPKYLIRSRIVELQETIRSIQSLSCCGISGDAGCVILGARNSLFCHSHERIHTVVLRGVRNISETLLNSPMKFLV